MLLELGADPDIKDNYGYTPLRYAVKRDMELGAGYEDTYQLMLSKTDLDSTDTSKLKCICIYRAVLRGPNNTAPSGRSSQKQESPHTTHSQRQDVRGSRRKN